MHIFTKQFKSDRKLRQRGYTLVETLVAITILMIAIAGPLTIASKGLNAALDARNEMIASNLAQEAMEYLQNAKDNGEWDFTTASCTSVSAPANACGVSPIQNGNPNRTWDGLDIKSCANLNSCKLTMGSNGLGYYYDGTASGANLTPFVRYFYISNPQTNTGNGGTFKDALISVVVTWTTGTVANQVTIQKIMSNATR